MSNVQMKFTPAAVLKTVRKYSNVTILVLCVCACVYVCV